MNTSVFFGFYVSLLHAQSFLAFIELNQLAQGSYHRSVCSDPYCVLNGMLRLSLRDVSL